LKYLVSIGADVNAEDDDGWTPLHFAAENNSNEMLKYLISVGADVWAEGNNGETPLGCAQTEETETILREVMEASKPVVNETKESITVSDFSYYVNTAKGQRGPFTLEQLKHYVGNGAILEWTEVSIGNTGKWIAAKAIPGLFPVREKEPVPPTYNNADNTPALASLAKLNEQQRQAVTTTEGYIRVIAGAGSGKTNALTQRYAHLVNSLGISPSDILCVTFTNKAAGEMKKRIRRMIGDFGGGRICTFHGFCVQLLKEDGHVIHYPPQFLILGDEDSKSMIKRCFEKLGITSKQITVKKAKKEIDAYKQDNDYHELLTDPRMIALLERRREARKIEEKIIYEYLHEQRKTFGLDFNDLIVLALHVLKTDERARTKWQQRLQYVMVDEFQDVDKKQYELATILSGYHKNLFVVGDPDQTIYTWRGARIEAILDFNKQFPTAQTIVMDVNYRSLSKVINASNSLIRKNKTRIDKNLIPHRKGNGSAKYFHAKTQTDEAGWIAKQIETFKGYGVSLSSIAVLYRAHYVSRSIEEALLKHRLPYTVYSGVGFYQRKEIKNVLSYLRLIYSSDDLSFLRIINEPRRGIGKKRFELLRQYTEKHNCSYWTALSNNAADRHFASTGAPAFLALINKYKNYYNNYTLSELLTTILDESGYEENLRTSGEEERLDNLAELKQSIYEYETTAGEETTLESYLQDIALFTSSDRNDETESVKMMTIHAAKGLEFPHVFVCGMSEGIFPSQKIYTPAQLEEERRLAYVAFTRAGDMLFLSDSEGINYDGSFRYPSRFIFDTEQVNLEYLVPLSPDLIEGTRRFAANHEKSIDKRPILSVGSKIIHDFFGKGTILSIDENQSCYLISFETIATPRAIMFNTPLKKVE